MLWSWYELRATEQSTGPFVAPWEPFPPSSLGHLLTSISLKGQKFACLTNTSRLG